MDLRNMEVFRSSAVPQNAVLINSRKNDTVYTVNGTGFELEKIS